MATAAARMGLTPQGGGAAGVDTVDAHRPAAYTPEGTPRGSMRQRGSSMAHPAETHTPGDRPSFEAIYDEYHAGIYNLCARILCDREEAKDVTQDVFVTAFSRLPGPTERSRRVAWLYRVATNACLNRLRARGGTAAPAIRRRSSASRRRSTSSNAPGTWRWSRARSPR